MKRVSKEQAIRLKPLGYKDYSSVGTYYTDEIADCEWLCVPASTLHQVTDWFREVNGLHCYAVPKTDSEIYVGHIIDLKRWTLMKINDASGHYEALSAAIDKALEIIKTRNNDKD